MFKEKMFRIAWEGLFACVLLIAACALNGAPLPKEKISTLSNCPVPLKKQEDSVIQKYLSFRLENDTDQARNTLKKIRDLANSGCIASQYKLGSELIGDDNHEAISWLEIAAKSGSLAAKYELYKLYADGKWKDEKGFQIQRDSIRARGFFDQALSRNYPPALVDLANKKIREAFWLYEQAADSGSIDGANFVAKAYKYGIGVEDELWAMYWKEYLYNSIAARLSASAERCHDFLEKTIEYEKGKSQKEIQRLRQSVDQWFENHPTAKLKDGGKCR